MKINVINRTRRPDFSVLLVRLEAPGLVAEFEVLAFDGDDLQTDAPVTRDGIVFGADLAALGAAYLADLEG